MSIVFRWMLRFAAGLVGLVVLAVVLIYYLASQSLPDYNRTIEVTG